MYTNFYVNMKIGILPWTATGHIAPRRSSSHSGPGEPGHRPGAA